MKTLSVQQMPTGFEIETPSFWYWLKAGVAFTIGAGMVAFVGGIFYLFVMLGLVAGALRH